MKSSDSLGPFSWDDPLLLDDQLTEEERMIRDAARAYAQDKLAPRVQSAYREERFDIEIMREMGALGLLGSTRLTSGISDLTAISMFTRLFLDYANWQ